MIEIDVIRQEDAIRAVVATGHAKECKSSVQICSGVSALMYTLVLNLREVNRVSVSVVDDDDGMYVDIIRGHRKSETKVITNTIVRGLKNISELYPHSVKMRIN